MSTEPFMTALLPSSAPCTTARNQEVFPDGSVDRDRFMAILGLLFGRRDWVSFENHLNIALPKSVTRDELMGLLNALDEHCSPADLADALAIARRICGARAYASLLRQHGIDD